MGNNYKLEIETDRVPKSLNMVLGKGHWGRVSDRKKWDHEIEKLCRGKLPAQPLKRANIYIERHSFRTLDYDGCVGSMKYVVDALVTCGVLVDDSWLVTGQWYVTQVYRPKKEGQKLVIVISEI